MAKRDKTQGPVDIVSAMLGMGSRMTPPEAPRSRSHQIKAGSPYVVRPLPDFRLADLDEAQALIQGQPPTWTRLPPFDPQVGPWSAKAAAGHQWAQSFEFSREFHALCRVDGWQTGAIETSLAWTRHWLADEPRAGLGRDIKALIQAEAPAIKGRRVLNWLAHVLPLLKHGSADLQRQVLDHLEADVRHLLAQQEAIGLPHLFSSAGQSARGRWLQSAAILGAATALPRIVSEPQASRALEEIEHLVCADGTYIDGDIAHTLSIGADLAMLIHNRKVDPVFQRVRTALSALKVGNGDVLDFGGGARHQRLLHAVLHARTDNKDTRSAPISTPPVSAPPVSSQQVSRLLLQACIAKVSLGPTDAWLSARPKSPAYGPALQIEMLGQALIVGHSGHRTSGLALFQEHHNQELSASVRRRDEGTIIHIEAIRKIASPRNGFVAGTSCELTCIRTLSLDATRQRLSGEDAVFAKTGHEPVRAAEFVRTVQFLIAEGARAQLGEDEHSVLIVTPAGHAMRFRAEGMDIRLKSGFENNGNQASPSSVWIEVNRAPESPAGRDFVLRWHFEVEEFV
jgi:uncharacterized heparinase superfamily protein